MSIPATTDQTSGLDALNAQRRAAIDDAAARVAAGESIVVLNYLEDLYARVCVSHLLDGDSPRLIRAAAELSKYAGALVREHLDRRLS